MSWKKLSNNSAQTGVYMKCLVTGATGFIGRYLCTQLVQCGYGVRGTYRTFHPPADYPIEIDWVRISDVGPETYWKVALDDVQFVVHLAALAHQTGARSESRYDEFMRVNALGTRRLAEEIASSNSVRRLVFISSIGAVTSLSSKRTTSTTLCDPDTDYGKSKLAAETAIQETLKSGSPDWCILRPPLVYGPGNPGNMARLLKLIERGLPLPLSAINNRRSFVFVGNLVDAIIECMTHPNASHQTFLISDGEDISTPELVRRIAEVSGRSVRLFPVPIIGLKAVGKLGNTLEHILGISTGLNTYSVGRLIGSLTVDSETIMQELGWFPPYTLQQGLELTILEPKKLTT